MMASAAVVSVTMGVMKPVLAKLTTLMGNEYKKLKGLRKEVAFLQRELSDMDALLEMMDLAHELDPQAKNWRKDIIEMSYDIEDYIDDFMHHVGEASDMVGVLQKASLYLRTFKDRRCLANKFQWIKTRVMEASKRRKRYMLDQRISIAAPIVIDPRLSTLYKESTSLVGIDTQKDKLVKWALDEKLELDVMAIAGLGGLGKTTLANEVYRQVGEQFDRKVFVSISEKPEIIGVFNSLLSQLGLGICSHDCQMQDLLRNIRGHLQDKRYLVVVDDLWDICTWNTICCAFPQNSQHSRIVITTRIEGVARECCGSTGFIYIMKPLSEADSRKLFFDRIFGSEDACPPELTKASDEILKKCGGLPLAIITMASMLACQPTRLEGQWDYIQNSVAARYATNSNYEDMMYILELSYKNLPHHLKACFLYLGSYPEDHQIRRVDLVRRWVAEGFVSSSTGQDVWNVAESYFNELINRSMIQPTYKDYTIGVSGCKVHDMLLELIIRRCKEDGFLGLINDPRTVAEVQDKLIRRLTFVGLRGIADFKVNLTHIRSLTVLQGLNLMPPLLELKYVRVLCIHTSSLCEMTLDLTGINQLAQLRYLKVEGKITLPSKIQGLRLLETLDFSRISHHRIPAEIVDVPRLAHLVVPSNTRWPNWIGKVKSLRTVRGFSLLMDSLESVVGLSDLTTLSNLDLYFPEGCSPLPKATWISALCTSLEKLSGLKELDLRPAVVIFGVVAWCADVLSSLSPPRHIESLDMSGCTFSRAPRWMGHLQNLCVLRLAAKHMPEEDIAMIGTRLPSLLELSLRIPKAPTEGIVIGGAMGFRILKMFRFDCDGISHLTFEAGAMPQLQLLSLIFAINKWDRATPVGIHHLPSLKKIIAQRANWQQAWSTMLMPPPEDYMEMAEAALVRGVFQEATQALPTRPAFIFHGRRLFRPVEEDEDFMVRWNEVDSGSRQRGPHGPYHRLFNYPLNGFHF